MGVQQLLLSSSRVHRDQNRFFGERGGCGQHWDSGEKYQQSNAAQFHADTPQNGINLSVHHNLLRAAVFVLRTFLMNDGHTGTLRARTEELRVLPGWSGSEVQEKQDF